MYINVIIPQRNFEHKSTVTVIVHNSDRYDKGTNYLDLIDIKNYKEPTKPTKKRNIEARSSNSCCNGNETMCSVCPTEVPVTVNNKRYSRLYVNWPTFLSDFNQI
jgi:hypothetical protein